MVGQADFYSPPDRLSCKVWEIFVNSGVCRKSENCKSLILQDQHNIEIFLFPAFLFLLSYKMLVFRGGIRESLSE